MGHSLTASGLYILALYHQPENRHNASPPGTLSRRGDRLFSYGAGGVADGRGVDVTG